MSKSYTEVERKQADVDEAVDRLKTCLLDLERAKVLEALAERGLAA